MSPFLVAILGFLGGVIVGALVPAYLIFFASKETPSKSQTFMYIIFGCTVSGLINCTVSGATWPTFIVSFMAVFVLAGAILG